MWRFIFSVPQTYIFNILHILCCCSGVKQVIGEMYAGSIRRGVGLWGGNSQIVTKYHYFTFPCFSCLSSISYLSFNSFSPLHFFSLFHHPLLSFLSLFPLSSSLSFDPSCPLIQKQCSRSQRVFFSTSKQAQPGPAVVFYTV